MTKAELIDALYEKFAGDVTKKMVGEMVDATFDSVATSIKKQQRFYWPSFGTFTVRRRKARAGRNPQTGATLKIKASKSVGFRPAPALKEKL